MTTTKKFRYIIGTSVGYLQDLNGKNMANMTERRLAFTFNRCDDAKAQKKILIKNKYEDVKIEKVYCNYEGKWEHDGFITGEKYYNDEVSSPLK